MGVGGGGVGNFIFYFLFFRTTQKLERVGEILFFRTTQKLEMGGWNYIDFCKPHVFGE